MKLLKTIALIIGARRLLLTGAIFIFLVVAEYQTDGNFFKEAQKAADKYKPNKAGFTRELAAILAKQNATALSALFNRVADELEKNNK